MFCFKTHLLSDTTEHMQQDSWTATADRELPQVELGFHKFTNSKLQNKSSQFSTHFILWVFFLNTSVDRSHLFQKVLVKEKAVIHLTTIVLVA